METKNSYLIKAKNAKDEDFNDLYFVNLDGVDLAPKDLDAEILVFRKSEFAVIRADDVQVAELSQKLHHMAAACGHLVRLSGDEVNKDMQESFAPGALIARQTKVEIGAFLESMKSLDIRERVALIFSFKTRYHTTSEGAEASLEIKECSRILLLKEVIYQSNYTITVTRLSRNQWLLESREVSIQMS